MFFAPSKSRQRAKIWIMGISKTSDHIQTKIKMPHPNQKPPASFKAPNEDLKNMDILGTLAIKKESQNLVYGITKDQLPYPNTYQDANPQSEPTASSKASNQDLKDMDVLCTFNIKKESQNLVYGCTKDQ